MTCFRLSFIAALSFLLLTIWSIAHAGNSKTVPVMVGGEADLDACGGVGKVSGLNPKGDGFLAVRSGPGEGYDMVDRIFNGQLFYACDEKGKWVGIVYSESKNADCKVSSPIARRQVYRGPCKQGWVHSKFTRMIAG